METEGSLPHSQVPANYPYPEPPRSSPYPKSLFLNIYLNIILPSMPGSPKRSLSLSLHHQNPAYTSLLPHTRATCPAHLIQKYIQLFVVHVCVTNSVINIHQTSPTTAEFLSYLHCAEDKVIRARKHVCISNNIRISIFTSCTVISYCSDS
jgi:hypothetical protein